MLVQRGKNVFVMINDSLYIIIIIHHNRGSATARLGFQIEIKARDALREWRASQ